MSGVFDSIKEFMNPSRNTDLSVEYDSQKNLPTLWLLGKTGAGKSSLIQSITGLSSIEVGNGFTPCTNTSKVYNFPLEMPLLRFLDTRGLGEANYDPKEDFDTAILAGHALVIVAKIEESEQSAVLAALTKIRKIKKIKHLLVVHTAALQFSETERERLISYNQHQFEQAWGDSINQVRVDFEEHDYGQESLLAALSELLPIIDILLHQDGHSSQEQDNFNLLKKQVVWYAGAASTSALLPVVGLVSVPSVQAKMLHSLANQYGVTWDKATFSELFATLGTSFGVQYGISLGARELTKLIPIYGQTAGAVVSASISFATTYALGRAACYYFFQKSNGQETSRDKLMEHYQKAFTKGKKINAN